MMPKIEIGRVGVFSKVYIDNGYIRFTGDCQMHKLILDRLGIYATFYPTRSGHRPYIMLQIPANDYIETIKKLRTIQKELQMQLLPLSTIKKKLDKIILEAI